MTAAFDRDDPQTLESLAREQQQHLAMLRTENESLRKRNAKLEALIIDACERLCEAVPPIGTGKVDALDNIILGGNDDGLPPVYSTDIQ